jgi:hypothetical protein
VDSDEKLFYLVTLSKYYWVLGRKKEAADVAEQTGIAELVKFYTDGNNDVLISEVSMKYNEIRDRGEYVSPFHVGVDYASVGAKNQALENFEKAIAIRDPGLPTLLSNGFYSFALIPQSDPAIQKIQQRIKGMIEYDW